MYIYGNVALYLMQKTRYLDLVIENYGGVFCLELVKE